MIVRSPKSISDYALIIMIMLFLYLLIKNGCNNIGLACNDKKTQKYDKESVAIDLELQHLDCLRIVITKDIERKQALDSQGYYYEGLLKKLADQSTVNRKKLEEEFIAERKVYVKEKTLKNHENY